MESSLKKGEKFMFDFDDPKFMEKLLGHSVDYDFKELLSSEDPDVKYLAKKLLTLDKALNKVVDSKETYLGSALHTEDTEKDALLDIFGFCQNVLNEVWDKYDENHRRH